jgi:hypothetical protein
MLIIGILGVVMCLTSAIVLGVDLTTYINSGFIMSGTLKFTSILETMRTWLPDTWMVLINYVNNAEPSLQKTITVFLLDFPVCFVGFGIGLLFVIIGFRVQRVKDDFKLGPQNRPKF